MGQKQSTASSSESEQQQQQRESTVTTTAPPWAPTPYTPDCDTPIAPSSTTSINDIKSASGGGANRWSWFWSGVRTTTTTTPTTPNDDDKYYLRVGIWWHLNPNVRYPPKSQRSPIYPAHMKQVAQFVNVSLTPTMTLTQVASSIARATGRSDDQLVRHIFTLAACCISHICV
jgi:hypothetical protein